MSNQKENKNIKFENLYKLYAKDILFFLYRLTKDIETSQDFLQETFVNFIKMFSDKDLPKEDKCKIYLFQTAKNLFINHYRKKKKEKLDILQKRKNPIEEEQENLLNSQYNLLEKYDQEKEKIFWDLLDTLEEEEKTIVILRYNIDMNLEEISKILKKSMSTISRRLEKIKKKLLKIAKERNYL